MLASGDNIQLQPIYLHVSVCMQEIINCEDALQLYSMLPLQRLAHTISRCEQFAIVMGVCS